MVDMTDTQIVGKAGRPSAITDDVVAKLEEIFKLDVTVEIACNYAQINPATYYRRYAKDEQFARRMEAAKYFARVAASNVVVDKIANDRDVNTAKWYLEKRVPEFRGGDDGKTINVAGDLNIQNVIQMSSDERQQRITSIEKRIAELESGGSSSKSEPG